MDANGQLKVAGGGGGTEYNRDDPAGANDLGKLALVVRSDAGGSLVGADGDYTALQVDANGALRVTGGGGGIEYDRDDAAGAADTGKMILAVRSDAGGSLVGADGDYTPIQVDANGAIRVTGGGGGTQYDEDDAHASGATGTIALAVRQDILAQLADTDGDYSVLLTDVFGQLYVREMYSSATATLLGTIDADTSSLAELVKAEDAAHVSGDKGIQALSVRQDILAALADTNGDYAPLLTDVFGQLYVREMYSSTIATAAEALNTSLTTDLKKAEDAAHVSGDYGLQMLAVRQDVLADSTDTDGDYTPLKTDIFGQVYVREMFSSATATAILALSKAEDAAHTSGDYGIMAMGVRKDETGAIAADSLRYAPFQVDAIGNLRTSSYVMGNVAHDDADSGNPVKVGGRAYTANPTAVADGDRVSAAFDKIGRQVFTPVQVRGLRQTAYVALTTGSAFGTETALLAGVASTYHDLIYIMGANDSSVAAKVVIRASTGGNPQLVLEIPANGTAGVSLPIPLPQDHADASWTVDAEDITGTNLYISALFSKEV
jgi:hypothetical protein